MGILDWFKPKPAKRADNLVNELLGFGTSRDKIAPGYFADALPLSDVELAAAYYHDDIAKKIVDARPEEMFRRGYELEWTDADTLRKKLKALDADTRLREGLKWGRLFGGSLVIMGANDGGLPWTPLQVERVTDVYFLNVLDRRRVHPYSYYADPLAPNYGKPEVYQILPNVLGYQPAGPQALIHESRCIRFDGMPVDLERLVRLNGWSYSVLQNPYQVIRDFETAFASAASLLSDASQGVFKIQGLIDMIASGESTTLQTRMALVDMYRSAMRAILLDADGEDFERKTTPLTGIPDMLDRFMMRMAAACDMPVTKLMGRSAAGLNATGESDDRDWYDSVANDQEKVLLPALERLVTVLTAGKWDGAIEFCPLWEPTEKEEAETEKLRAETEQIRITSGVLLPEQVTLANWGGKPYEETIDVAALEQSMKAEIDLALNPPPAPPAPDPNTPAPPVPPVPDAAA